MKRQIRILGIDDSPFTFTEKYSTIIGVVMRGGEYLEGVLSRQVKIDGSDATFVCTEMIENTRHKKQLRTIMVDGIALGGFNVIDIQKIFVETGLPVIFSPSFFRPVTSALIIIFAPAFAARRASS